MVTTIILLVEPAPLPPHERSWRHPSELGASTVVETVDRPANRRALVLAGGSTVAVLALVLVATVSTGRSPAPFAVSATTVPMARMELRFQPAGSTAEAGLGDRGVWRNKTNSITGSSILAISGAPNFVSAAPVVDPDVDSLVLASGLPDDGDHVLVLTESHAYRLLWGGIDGVVAPDDAIVMTLDGGLVAVFVSGELRLLVDA